MTDSTVYQEYSTGRARRHMLMKRPQFIFVFTLILLDVATVWLSYYGAYLLVRRGLEYPELEIAPFWDEIWLLPAIASGILVMSFFTQRMYQRRRPISHFDEYYKIVVFSSFTTLLTIAVLELSVRTEYHRWLFAYATILCIAIAMVLRTV
ncbi:MAG: hypothetical protein KDE53_02380, partial [Caldilineaceae bacterium]|nr:hypothetical protein [Caldilineaceae bacterium]